MKKLITFLSALLLVLLCACGSVEQPDASEAGSGGDDPANESEDSSRDGGVTLADYAPDDALRAAFAKTIEDFPGWISTYDNARRLRTLSVKKTVDSSDDVVSFLAEFKKSIADLGWYKELRFYRTNEKDAFESEGHIVYVDSGYALTEDISSDEPVIAGYHLIDCSKVALQFMWCYQYLTPKFSELCGSRQTETPTEDEFRTAAFEFARRYFPDYAPDDEQTITVEVTSCSATAYLYRDRIILDPDNENEPFIPCQMQIDFSFDETNLLLSRSDEKAVLKSFTLFYPYECVAGEAKPLLTPDEAWNAAVNGAAETGNEQAVPESFKQGDLFVLDYCVCYRMVEDEYAPYYLFLCAENVNEKPLRLYVRAT